jgi:hypothetical protein
MAWAASSSRAFAKVRVPRTKARPSCESQVRPAATFRNLSIAWILALGPALADTSGCDASAISDATRKGIQDAAKRAGAETADLATLHYCRYPKFELATVNTEPLPGDGGSIRIGTLSCALPKGSREWNCYADRYQAIRLSPAAGQPEVNVRVYGGEVESTRERAGQAFRVLAATDRIEACQKNISPLLSIDTLRDVFASQTDAYRLYDSRDGFDLVHGPFHIRFRVGAADGGMNIECWDEDIIEE